MTKRTRGTLSARLAGVLSGLAGQDRVVFAVDDFVRAAKCSRQKAWRALNSLTDGGWTVRLAKGRYLLVPLEAGPKATWTEDALVIACHLATPAAVAYWSACHYWNWTEQVSRTAFAQTTWRVRPRVQKVLGVTYRFIRVTPKKFFGTIERTAGQGRFTITDREKTLVDALDRPDLCGGIGQVSEVLAAADEIDWDTVEAYIERMGSGAVYKRLGFLVEMLGEKTKIPGRKRRLEVWQSKLTGGHAPLEPGGPRTGSANSRWLIRVNVPGMGGNTEKR